MEKMLRTQFHRVNKVYSIIDPSHKEKIDRSKFRTLLEKCSVEMSDAEIDLLWKDFEADVVPFSNFVRRFFKPAEFDRIRDVHYKRKIGSTLSIYTNTV